MESTSHKEQHRTNRIGWLRAAVLGANDGILSTASLTVGVAGLVAGAMSMAAGEYVSVSSQADTEKADLLRERKELKEDDAGEHRELASIYVKRGLDPALAKQVAKELMAKDALGAHARDELGISVNFTARPVQAALATTLVFLAALGVLAALAGGAPIIRSAIRVTFWGALAMGLTAVVGALFGTMSH
ncbi:MAG: VIT family protein [Candidatus Omnitrophica bacterium]|nr:VIT family protein [Candidatus Omnitrophota bacterium]